MQGQRGMRVVIGGAEPGRVRPPARGRRVRIGSLLSAWGRLRGAATAPAPDATSLDALKVGYLSAIDVFRDLPRSEVEHLAETTTMFTVPRGRVIYRPGEYNSALYLLKKGRVQVVRESADGKRLILATLGPETFFGEMALIGQRFPQDSTAEALEDALVCILSRRDLERLILEHPKVGLRFLEQLSARLLETEQIVEDFAFKSVPARLAGVLLRLMDSAENDTVQASHQELADMIATYRETATLTLDEFQERGLVELGRRSVRIVDPAGLQTIADS
jgi:CRP/FNR family transcriptional regulator, cyclic AMP receptor protein